MGSRSCDGQDRKRSHALGAVDENSLDEWRMDRYGRRYNGAISVMEIDDDVGGIEQHDQVLRDAQLPLAEQD